MEFGISLPGRGPLAKPDQVLSIAAKADALGYASIFVTDHVVLPASMARSVYPYSATGQLPGGAAQDYLEPLAMLGCLARATKRARLGTSVLVVPYRHPLLTAKILATVDQLSGGRVILGAGVGWLREEFEALGAPPFEERGAVTDEYLRFMRATWTTDPVSFTGRYVSVHGVHALPKPAQPAGIPVWIGGHTDAAVRRAATLGDGWHPIALRPPGLLFPDEYATRARQIQAWAKDARRDPHAVTLTVRVPMEVRSKPTSVKPRHPNRRQNERPLTRKNPIRHEPGAGQKLASFFPKYGRELIQIRPSRNGRGLFLMRFLRELAPEAGAGLRTEG